MFEQRAANPFSDELEHKWNKYAHEARHLEVGGESEIYELMERPDIVVKLDWRVPLKILRENDEQGLPPDALDDVRLAALQAELSKEEKAYNDFKKHFGNHALVQKRYLIKIPYKKLDTRRIELDARFYLKRFEPEYIWTIARIQRKVAFDKYDKEFEGKIIYSDTYEEPNISDLLQEHDPGFKQALKDFVQRAINYTADTGEIMDIGGRRNVVFLKNEDGWDYKLLDTFFAHRPGIKELKQGHGFARINAENYRIIITKLAEYLGINEGLDAFLARFNYRHGWY